MRHARALLITTTLLAAWIPAVARSEAPPPNVLLIMTDDQGWGDVGRHGNDQIDTPTLDALHDTSVRFERFYVSPVCAPTRASLLTGRYDVRTGVRGVTQRFEVLPADEVTLAEVFAANDYVTGCFGKWHNGLQYPNNPQGQGFDEFFGFCAGHWNDYFDATLQHNGEPVETSGYITDLITDAALAFIESHHGEPFFCYVPFNAPHTPWQVPDRYFEKYSAAELPATTASAYAMVECIDDNIARLLAQLDQLELRSSTIVIFLTDNGPNGDRYNGDMRGRKGQVHEGGVRVPCYVNWPGELTPHAVATIATHIDMLPTLAELCGLQLPPAKPLDGISLVPLLRSADAGASTPWPDRKLYTFRSSGQRNGKPVVRGAVRTQRYRFVRDGKDQLFDMQQDPAQTMDIAGAQPLVLDELRSAFDDWLADVDSADARRSRIPVGLSAAPHVELPAVEARFAGNPRFHNGNGYAHDWITDWTSTYDRIWWDLDVAAAGEYELTLSYACPADALGARVRLSAIADSPSGELADQRTFAMTDAFDTGTIARPERDQSGGPRWMREFRTQPIGRLRLPAGPVRLQMQATSIPGGSVCELDGLRLQHSDDARH